MFLAFICFLVCEAHSIDLFCLLLSNSSCNPPYHFRTCDCSERPPNEDEMYRLPKSNNDKQVFILKGLPTIGNETVYLLILFFFLKNDYTSKKNVRPGMYFLLRKRFYI